MSAPGGASSTLAQFASAGISSAVEGQKPSSTHAPPFVAHVTEQLAPVSLTNHSGSVDGDTDGETDGAGDGLDVGLVVGESVGLLVGPGEGNALGDDVGLSVGQKDGRLV